MNRRIALLPSLLAIAVLSLPAVTSAQAIHDRIRFDTYFTEVLYDDCTGEFVVATGIFRFSEQRTLDDAGGAHAIFHVDSASLTGIGDSGTVYEVIGNDHFAASAPQNGSAEGTGVFTFDLVSHGSSANFEFMELFHYVLDPDGSVKVETDHVGIGCRG